MSGRSVRLLPAVVLMQGCIKPVPNHKSVCRTISYQSSWNSLKITLGGKPKMLNLRTVISVFEDSDPLMKIYARIMLRDFALLKIHADTG